MDIGQISRWMHEHACDQEYNSRGVCKLKCPSDFSRGLIHPNCNITGKRRRTSTHTLVHQNCSAMMLLLSWNSSTHNHSSISSLYRLHRRVNSNMCSFSMSYIHMCQSIYVYSSASTGGKCINYTHDVDECTYEQKKTAAASIISQAVTDDIFFLREISVGCEVAVLHSFRGVADPISP